MNPQGAALLPPTGNKETTRGSRAAGSREARGREKGEGGYSRRRKRRPIFDKANFTIVKTISPLLPLFEEREREGRKSLLSTLLIPVLEGGREEETDETA